ncbi:MAG TPA: hypothetical protein VJ941_02600, partial [Gracilimonas sp.]|nr:hypothetical protein [Gracilimonas sp.]
MLLSRKNIAGVQKYVLLSGIGIALLAGCSSENETEPVPQHSLPVTVSEPVEKDLAEIKQNGVLRMITSYSSNSYFLYKG